MSFKRPVIKNPTRHDAGPDSPQLKTERVSARLGANSGNAAFIFAITRTIAGIRHISEVKPGYGDVNILGSSNQINPNIQKSADDAVFQGTDAPFVAIGLGAQAPSVDEIMDMPEGAKAYVKRIQDSSPGDAPNIAVRGSYTYAVLKKAGLHEKAVPLGCPSLFIHPNPKLGVLISRKLEAAPEHWATCAGNIAKPARKHATLEASLARLAEEGGGGYVLQHPVELMHLVRDGFDGTDPELVERVRAAARPDLDAAAFRRWFRREARLFTAAVPWMEHYRSLDLVTGTRIHGCMLALAAGTPAVVIALDSRQTELCEIMHVPSIPAEELADGFTIEPVVERLRSHDWERFDANRAMLAEKYASFLEANQLTPTKLLLNLAGRA